MKKFDVAAYIWPAYSDNPQTKQFWEGHCGEWQSVMSAKPKFPGHRQPRVPLWGYVNEADPRVMEMEIEVARQYGVNVFLYDWYFYQNDFFLEDCLEKGFLRARNCSAMQFYLMYSNHHVNYVWDKRRSSQVPETKILWDARIDEGQWERITDRMIEKYFSCGNYYRDAEGKPLILIYDAAIFVGSFAGIEGAKKALKRFREKAVAAGFPGVHIQFTLRNRISADGLGSGDIQAEYLNCLEPDSVTCYQFVHMEAIENQIPYSVYAKRCLKTIDRVAAEIHAPLAPHLSLGWDNNPRYESGCRDVVREASAREFREICQLIREKFDKSETLFPLLTINSWNEWTEGSYLMPDTVKKYEYLKIIRECFSPEKVERE